MSHNNTRKDETKEMEKEETEGYATPGRGSAKHSAPITRLMGGGQTGVRWG